MRLDSSEGAHVELHPTGYQYPSMKPSVVGDWDANWLVVAGDVRLADGRRWSFSDSCLTTWEAHQLGEWLHGVLVGDVHPGPFDGDHAQVTYFTEPNVGVSLAARDDVGVTIRFHFSLESEPPWLRHGPPAELFEYVVELAVTFDDLARATDEWTRELAAFPVR